MNRTIGGIAAVVASLLTGCSSEPKDYSTWYVAPANIGFGNWLGNGCPIYGVGRSTYHPYDFTLTDSDIWLTEGNPRRVFNLSADRILAQKTLHYPIENTSDARENARNYIKTSLLFFNPQFYTDYRHRFKAGETIRYPSFRADETGGTLNCTL